MNWKNKIKLKNYIINVYFIVRRYITQKWLNWFSQNLRCILQSIQLGILATCHSRISFERGIAKRTPLKNGRYRACYWFNDKNPPDRNYKLLAFEFQINWCKQTKLGFKIYKKRQYIFERHVNFWKHRNRILYFY